MKIKYFKSVKIYQVVDALEHYAPLPLQEGYDNAGLQVGLTEAVEVSGALLCLDVTETVVDEAIRKGCNLIVSHHPLIFRKLARISDENYVQRTVRKAIKNDITIVSMHTNMPIRKVALCGGAGSFLLDAAIAAGADAFITGEMHYHEFFGHEQEIQICVIGHYQSEQFTSEIFRSIITEKCPGVKCEISEINTNPIIYL